MARVLKKEESMNIKQLLIFFVVMLFASTAAFGQSSGQEQDDDPFKNDPFFSKPLDELLHKDSESNSKETVDSTSTDSESHEVRHYVSRIHVEGIDYGGAFEAGPYSSNALYMKYPTLPMIHFNRVDGFFLGIRKERMQWYNNDDLLGITNIHPHGMLGYSFGQESWQYEAGLERYLGFKDHILIGAEFYNATTTDDHWRVGLTETSLTSFFAGYDFLDYYQQKGWGTYLLMRTDRFLEAGVSYNDNRFNSLEQQTDYTMFGSRSNYRFNPPVEILNGRSVDTLNISSLSFSAAYNPKRLILLPHFTFSLFGTMEVGDPGFSGSDYSYTKYLAEMISYLNFEPGGVLKYRLKAGSITGDAPLMKEFQLGGPGSLRALPLKSIPGERVGGNNMILSNAELQFGSTGHHSGDWIDFDDFYFSLFLDSGWVTDEVGNNSQVFDGFSAFSFDDLEHNGGFGLGTNSFRFELAWDLHNTSRSPVLWFRLNPTF